MCQVGLGRDGLIVAGMASLPRACFFISGSRGAISFPNTHQQAEIITGCPKFDTLMSKIKGPAPPNGQFMGLNYYSSDSGRPVITARFPDRLKAAVCNAMHV